MREVVIVGAVRSPIGKFGGALARVRPDDLLAHTYRALMQRTGVDPALLDDVYAGCGNQAGEDNRDVARMAVLLAGFPTQVPGVTLNRNCASALEAINQAAKSIISGEGDIYIGSGVESMSRAPWSVPKPERTPTNQAGVMHDTTVGWRYNNPRMNELYPIVSLGETAENIADEMQISREDQDRFALESQRRAIAAINRGDFRQEIAALEIPQRKGDVKTVDTDEHPRYRRNGDHFELAIDGEDLARLKAVFRKGGTVTAGNSSGINDGAAAVLLMSREKADELGIKPMARWLGSAVAGVDPGVMGYGPVPATRKLLKRLDLSIDDLGLVELNEAFAAQALGCIRQLGLDHEITNVNGSGIALGHPVGCTGVRLIITLIYEMKRRKSHFGLATLCSGGGMGMTTIIENLV